MDDLFLLLFIYTVIYEWPIKLIGVAGKFVLTISSSRRAEKKNGHCDKYSYDKEIAGQQSFFQCLKF